MKKPSENQMSILISKISGYVNNSYYGGNFTYYEIVLLVYYFKVIVDKRDSFGVNHCKDKVAKGEIGSRWFYFNLGKRHKLLRRIREK